MHWSLLSETRRNDFYEQRRKPTAPLANTTESRQGQSPSPRLGSRGLSDPQVVPCPRLPAATHLEVGRDAYETT